jgi:hypothetical protein
VRKAFVVILLLFALAGAGAWLLSRHTAQPGSTPQVTVPSVIGGDDTKPDAQALQSALNSTDPATQAKVMSPDLVAAYAASGHNMLPPGGSIRLQPDTLKVNGNAASMDAVITRSDGSTTYAMLLVRQDANSPWQILTTEGK